MDTQKQSSSANRAPDRDSSAEQKSKGTFYQIRVNDHLYMLAKEWFGELSIVNLENGEALMSGYLPDQSALMGILLKIHELNLKLLSVTLTNPESQR